MGLWYMYVVHVLQGKHTSASSTTTTLTAMALTGEHHAADGREARHRVGDRHERRVRRGHHTPHRLQRGADIVRHGQARGTWRSQNSQ